MTIDELIELLRQLPGDTEVFNCQVVPVQPDGRWTVESIGTPEHFEARTIPRLFKPRHQRDGNLPG
jgi:hypothetical protein